MDNDTSSTARRFIARRAGSLSLAVWHDGTTPDEHGGLQQQYGYRIADATRPGVVPHDERDIYSGAEVDTTVGLRTLVAFLSEAGKAYRDQMSNPLSESENLDLFPAWVTEAAYHNSEELRALAFELGHPDKHDALETPVVEAPPAALTDPGTGGPVWPPGRYYTVVFLQDEEGHAVVDLLQEQGVQAAIDHLAQWDYGSETLDAALFNQDLHAEVPHYWGTREASGSPYVLTYNAGLGTVHLLRELPAQAPDGWPDRYSGVSHPDSDTPVTPATATQATTQRAAARHAIHPDPARTRPDDGPSL